jgi:predicted transposase YdaD
LVQPRQTPDGLLEVHLAGQSEARLFLVEIATYPERRLLEQVLRDTALVYLDRRVLPEVLTLVLHPKGQLRITGNHEETSPLGWARLQCNWRVVELWTLPAADLLAANDLGIIPWVPLAHFDGPPELVLQQVRQRIDQQAPPDERANLLAVTQVLTRLRYNDPQLLSLLGGSQIMIESPLIQEIVARTRHEAILGFLEARFGSVPPEVVTQLRTILDEEQLRDLNRHAALCPDLAAFQARLAR